MCAMELLSFSLGLFVGVWLRLRHVSNCRGEHTRGTINNIVKRIPKADMSGNRIGNSEDLNNRLLFSG